VAVFRAASSSTFVSWLSIFCVSCSVLAQLVLVSLGSTHTQSSPYIGGLVHLEDTGSSTNAGRLGKTNIHYPKCPDRHLRDLEASGSSPPEILCPTPLLDTVDQYPGTNACSYTHYLTLRSDRKGQGNIKEYTTLLVLIGRKLNCTVAIREQDGHYKSRTRC